MKITSSNHRPGRVAVLGTGTMGTAMVARLLDVGMNVAVWSRRSQSTKSAVERGAIGFSEVADAVAIADVVITMLPNYEVVHEVMFDQKVIDALRPQATWAQMSTIGVSATARLSTEVDLRRPDVAFVDSPVSGSRGPAESGELLILASGPSDDGGVLGDVFRALGKRTIWLGSAGAGSAMKLVLNTWLAFQTEGAAESAALAESLHIAPSLLRKALSDSPLASTYALSKLDRMLDGDFQADFAIDLALKDLDLVAADADAAPIASAIARRWRELVNSGSSGLDVSAARRGLGKLRPRGGNRRFEDQGAIR